MFGVIPIFLMCDTCTATFNIKTNDRNAYVLAA